MACECAAVTDEENLACSTDPQFIDWNGTWTDEANACGVETIYLLPCRPLHANLVGMIMQRD